MRIVIATLAIIVTALSMQAVLSQPAYAAKPGYVSITTVTPKVSVTNDKDSAHLVFTVSNKSKVSINGILVSIKLPGNFQGIKLAATDDRCLGSTWGALCRLSDLPANHSIRLKVKVVVPKDFNGQFDGNSSADLRLPFGQQGVRAKPAQAGYTLSVNKTDGVPAGPTDQIGSLSGKVTNGLDEKVVPNAAVKIQDEFGHEYPLNTDQHGEYMFTSTAEFPLMSGSVTVSAKVAGFQPFKVSKQITAGEAYENFNLALTPIETISQTTEAVAPVATPAATTSAQTNQVRDESTPASVWIMGIIGLLIVIGGIVGLILAMRRRQSPRNSQYPTPIVVSESLDPPTMVIPVQRESLQNTGVYPANSGSSLPGNVPLRNSPSDDLNQHSPYPPAASAQTPHPHAAHSTAVHPTGANPAGIHTPGIQSSTSHPHRADEVIDLRDGEISNYSAGPTHAGPAQSGTVRSGPAHYSPSHATQPSHEPNRSMDRQQYDADLWAEYRNHRRL